jgi:hypothetical protein
MTGAQIPSYSWRSTFPIPATLAHGISGCRAFSSSVKRRLASEMISTPRSTSQRLRQSASKASNRSAGARARPRRCRAPRLRCCARSRSRRCSTAPRPRRLDLQLPTGPLHHAITGRENRELPLSALLRQPTDLGGKVSLGANSVVRPRCRRGRLRLGVEIRNQLDQQPKEAVMAAIDYRSDRHPSGRRRSPRAAQKEDSSACAARGARASAARERPQRLVLTLSRARRAKGPCRRW